MKRVLALGLTIAAGGAVADPVTYAFEWAGGGGYAIKGALQFDDAAYTGRFVREQDLSCFVIEGSKDGEDVGRWALTMLNEQTSWRMHFDPVLGRFLVEGEGVWMPQAWNMNGEGIDCGEGGFGFNIGNAAQDICVDNQLIFESQVTPEEPFLAARMDEFEFPRDACIAPPLLGWLHTEN
ncbi:MAG: hypothetical protein CMF72_08355 [Mameliella sp.]|nr:hypothetical protein [Mameliella sp.]|tara:strand:- start:3626 stop:4165 length:540 start_codon:yes stop_codon:yes gene_type:complete